ncbi:MAG TPA: FHA domain-containing protein [Gemmatales bacterium]|nr:FHA domain-containing protein [Gemmatales bacterium]
MQKSLLVVGGTNHGKVVPIIVQEFRIGRDAMCHLRPASTDISRLHCAIVSHPDGRVFLRDYASSNGTIINQRFLIGGEYELKDGDTLEVGPLGFRFHLQGAAASTLSASVVTTNAVPQAPRPATSPVPPPLPRPVLPGLTTVSSVPRYSYSEESALETTPDILTDSHIFSVHDQEMFQTDTMPDAQVFKGSRKAADAGPMLVENDQR